MRKASLLTLVSILGLGFSSVSYAAYPFNSYDLWRNNASNNYQYNNTPTINNNTPDYNGYMRYRQYTANPPIRYNGYRFHNYNYNHNNYYNNNQNYTGYRYQPYNYYGNYQQPYYNQPISSEFYKNVFNLNDGVTINITTNNYSIVSMIQSTIYQSMVSTFNQQPVNITSSNLYNGASVTITASSGGYNNLYSVWDSYSRSYITIDGYTFVRSIQDFAANTMPTVRYDGAIQNWN